MKLNMRFYDTSINFMAISSKRLVLGIAIGLASAFAIYGFFYMLSESFRVIYFGFINYGFQNSQNIINKTDRDFYNIFFAGLSLILGNAITILFLFSRSNKIIDKLNPKRKRILNDQIFFSFNFVWWFNKIGLSFGVLSMCCMDFIYVPYFKTFAYLLLVVLYLESWKNLSLVIRKNRFKIQCLHFLLILVLTLCLSRINIVDYKFIDELSLKFNPLIDLPNSKFYNEQKNKRDFEIIIKLKLNENNTIEIFTEDKQKIYLENIINYISKESASKREELRPFLSVRILSDKNIQAKYVKMVEAEAYLAGVYRINYEVFNKNFYQTHFENGTIIKRQNKSILQFENSPRKMDASKLMPPEQNYLAFDTIRISIQNKFKFNSKLVSKKKMDDLFEININANVLFLYEINNASTFQNYIDVLSAHNKAVNKLRTKEQTIFMENRFDYSKPYYDEQLKLKRKYPINIIERLN